MMSASTTSTVGSRMRCLARSRRREGTVTRRPAAASDATRWRPMKPEPPTTSTLLYFIRMSALRVLLFVLYPLFILNGRRLDAARRQDRAKARLQRHRLLVEDRAVHNGVRHDLAHVVASLGKRNRLDVDRAFERARVAPAPRARRTRVVRGGSEHRVAELLHHQAHVAGAERHVGFDVGHVLGPVIAQAQARGDIARGT